MASVNYSRPTGGASPASKVPKASAPGTLLRDPGKRGGSGQRGPKVSAAPSPSPRRGPSNLPHGAQSHPHPPKVTGTPNWLAPLSQHQIVQQARDTISKAYGSSYGELSSETRQAQAISDKRASDNRYYNTWLATQGQMLQAHADSINQGLSTLEGQLTAAQQKAYGGQATGLVQGANDRQGNVSNNAQSTAFGQDLTQNQNANVGLLAGSQLQSVAGQKATSDELSANLANDTAFIQSGETKRIADLNTALTAIGQARSKLNTSKTGDIAKEIARLQGVEINKAQSNRDYSAAIQKLGIQAASAQSLITDRAARTRIALTSAQQAQRNSDRTYKLNVDKYGTATARDLYERQHGLGPYKVSKGAGGNGPGGASPLTQASQNTLYTKIDTTTGEIEHAQRLYESAGDTPDVAARKAWHLLKTGGVVYATEGGKTVPIHFSPAGNIQILNAAYNVRSDGPGLNSGDIAALKHMGLAHPGRRYRSAPDTSGVRVKKAPSLGGF